MGKNNHKGPTQMSLYMRIVVGGYLVYLAYDIFKLRDTQASDYWFMMVSVVLFTVIGIILAAMSIKGLIKKDYYDPNNDSTDQDAAAENTESEKSEEEKENGEE
ncbi:MAG: hypothetical protein QM697_01880 [Lachnospiraceae bacterium]